MVETITIGTISVRLTRKRVRNINLRIHPDGSVHVSAPFRTPLPTIASFIESKRNWIEANQAKLAQQSSVMSVSCEDGETLHLWGKPHTIRIIWTEQAGKSSGATFECVGDELRVQVRDREGDTADEARTRRDRALDRWLRKQLLEQIGGLLPHCEEVVGRHASTIRIKSMRSRWGSCNTKTGAISIAVRLVHFDPHCLEMVLYHELCHLIEPNHGERFHALMDSFCPDWRERSSLLAGR